MIGGFIGFVGVGWAVGFLAVATRSRMPTLRRFMIYAPIVGGVVLGVSTLASQIGQMQVISDVLDGPRTVDGRDRHEQQPDPGRAAAAAARARSRSPSAWCSCR